MMEKQCIIFKINEEEYGIEIDYLKESVEYKKALKISNTPNFVDG